MTNIIDIGTGESYQHTDQTKKPDTTQYQPRSLSLPQQPSPEEVKSARLYAGFTVNEAAKQCDVSKSTWHRWEASNGEIPLATWAWFRILTDGVKANGGDDWEGWGFHSGYLYSPENEEYTPGSIRAIPYYRATIQNMEYTNKQLKKSLESYRKNKNWSETALGQIDLISMVVAQLMGEYEDSETSQLNELTPELKDTLMQLSKIKRGLINP